MVYPPFGQGEVHTKQLTSKEALKEYYKVEKEFFQRDIEGQDIEVMLGEGISQISNPVSLFSLEGEPLSELYVREYFLSLSPEKKGEWIAQESEALEKLSFGTVMILLQSWGYLR